MYEEKSYNCPLTGREMWDAECYDVQMVHYGFMKSNILDFIFDKSEANIKCENCPFNQLKQSPFKVKKEITA